MVEERHAHALPQQLDRGLIALHAVDAGIQEIGPPDEILTRKDRMRRQGWMCADCYDVVRSAVPIPVPAPCTKCGGIIFRAARRDPSCG